MKIQVIENLTLGQYVKSQDTSLNRDARITRDTSNSKNASNSKDKSNSRNTNSRDATIAGRPSKMRTLGTKGTPAAAGKQATAVMTATTRITAIA